MEERLLYLNLMAGTKTVCLCDMMWSFVSTVRTDYSWSENTLKKSSEVIVDAGYVPW